jgi:TRAP-type mannitol/chloroaromatic compound transport system permease small subunit
MKLVHRIEQFNSAVGQACAWLTLVMVLVTFLIVIMRYVFDLGWIWLQETVIWMHAAVFMLAAAYTLARNEHVRVDIFYKSMSARGQAIVNALGTLFFLIPVAVFLIWSSASYVAMTWRVEETSVEAGGLAYPWVPVLKTFIPVMATLLLLQGIAILLRSITEFLSDERSTR